MTWYRIIAKSQSIAEWLDANSPFDWEAVSIVDNNKHVLMQSVYSVHAGRRRCFRPPAKYSRIRVATSFAALRLKSIGGNASVLRPGAR